MEKQKNRPALRFPEFTSEWESKKLGEIAKFSKGKGIPKIDISADGATECIRYGELYTRYNEVINVVYSKTNIDKKDLILSAANDVIIPASGETQIDIATASCVLRSGIALGGDLNIIKTKNNGVFLSYYLNNRKKLDIASLAQGISVVHLYSSQLALLSLNLPILSEQQKIATFLTAIDDKLNQLKKKKTLLEQYKKGVMQGIFKVSALGFVGLEDDRIAKKGIEREILKSSNHKNPNSDFFEDDRIAKEGVKREILKSLNPKNPNSDFFRFSDDDGKEFPEWEEKTLEEVCEIIGGGTPDTNIEEFWNGEIQWFTPTEIKGNFVSKSLRTITELGLKKSSARILPKGAILLTTRATIGEASIALEECTTNQGFQSLVAKKDIHNIFVFNWIKMNRHELMKRANGSTFPEISKSETEQIIISIPTYAEQTKIANFLSAIDEKIEYCGYQIGKTEQYKKGLLQEMFV